MRRNWTDSPTCVMDLRYLQNEASSLQPTWAGGLFHAAAAASELAICVLDRDSRFVSVNAKLASECRCTPDDMLGRTARESLGDLAAQIEPAFNSHVQLPL